MILILGLGILAMMLSIAGIYGVVSFMISQRTRELGIRLVLGATKADILREVLETGSRPVLLGLFAGLWLALAVGSTIRHIFLNTPFLVDATSPVVCTWGGAGVGGDRIGGDDNSRSPRRSERSCGRPALRVIAAIP